MPHRRRSYRPTVVLARFLAFSWQPPLGKRMPLIEQASCHHVKPLSARLTRSHETCSMVARTARRASRAILCSRFSQSIDHRLFCWNEWNAPAGKLSINPSFAFRIHADCGACQCEPGQCESNVGSDLVACCRCRLYRFCNHRDYRRRTEASNGGGCRPRLINAQHTPRERFVSNQQRG